LGDLLLLDTHAFIWWRENSSQLGNDARGRISSASVVFVSLASAWEAAIKIALGKLRLPESFEAGVIASRFDKLPIEFSHTEAVATLPRHHNDPFDRMLIAQAMTERLTLVTHDRRFAPYGIDVVWT
jgi:PIN domain nuclease of toxin-antitoxin system